MLHMKKQNSLLKKMVGLRLLTALSGDLFGGFLNFDPANYLIVF